MGENYAFISISDAIKVVFRYLIIIFSYATLNVYKL